MRLAPNLLSSGWLSLIKKFWQRNSACGQHGSALFCGPSRGPRQADRLPRPPATLLSPSQSSSFKLQASIRDSRGSKVRWTTILSQMWSAPMIRAPSPTSSAIRKLSRAYYFLPPHKHGFFALGAPHAWPWVRPVAACCSAVP